MLLAEKKIIEDPVQSQETKMVFFEITGANFSFKSERCLAQTRPSPPLLPRTKFGTVKAILWKLKMKP